MTSLTSAVDVKVMRLGELFVIWGAAKGLTCSQVNPVEFLSTLHIRFEHCWFCESMTGWVGFRDKEEEGEAEALEKF
ncbi:hypothetical protein RRG08_005725 [Elysia crispata]|uniref:Uncharacterized protein n=1 Tax=Elysia crispata TaxID=231223 RepID=A0AAE1CWA9_9GAST|nr:hypothetical protein RRG08_005725 [Elysia crispata]